jgi:hypothetical protein
MNRKLKKIDKNVNLSLETKTNQIAKAHADYKKSTMTT